MVRDITVDAADQRALSTAIVEADRRASTARSVVDTTDRTLLHARRRQDRVSATSTRCETRDDLSMAYTPGVARVCTAIAEDPDKAFQYTIKRNTVAVVTDGTAVLGLGDIGPAAAMPVMEGKAMLFKEFAGVDAFPICLDTKDPDEIVADRRGDRARLRRHQPRGHLARRAASRSRSACRPTLDIPVFHDDQHGTAIVVLAALLNALQAHRPRHRRPARAGRRAGRRRRRRDQDPARRRRARASSACDSRGALHTGPRRLPRRLRDRDQALVRREHQPRAARPAGPADVIEGMDLFIGLSGARVAAAEALGAHGAATRWSSRWPTRPPRSRPRRPRPTRASIATGRSDYPNQINNVLALPGHLPRRARRPRAPHHRGDEDGRRARRSRRIVRDDELREDYIIPSVFNRDVAPAVAAAVARAARADRRGAGRAAEFGFAAATPTEFLAIHTVARRAYSGRWRGRERSHAMRVTLTGATGRSAARLVAALRAPRRRRDRALARPARGARGARRRGRRLGPGERARAGRGAGRPRRRDPPRRRERRPALERRTPSGASAPVARARARATSSRGCAPPSRAPGGARLRLRGRLLRPARRRAGRRGRARRRTTSSPRSARCWEREARRRRGARHARRRRAHRDRARPSTAARWRRCCRSSSSASAAPWRAAASTCRGSTSTTSSASTSRALDDDAWTGPVNATAPEPVTNRTSRTRSGARCTARPFAPVPALRACGVLYGEMAEIVVARPARGARARRRRSATASATRTSTRRCGARWRASGRPARGRRAGAGTAGCATSARRRA